MATNKPKRLPLSTAVSTVKRGIQERTKLDMLAVKVVEELKEDNIVVDPATVKDIIIADIDGTFAECRRCSIACIRNLF